MQNLIKSLTNILLIGAIITNILLYNTIKQMSPFIKKTEPSKISEKPVSTTLNVKSEFIYFEGNIIEDGKKLMIFINLILNIQMKFGMAMFLYQSRITVINILFGQRINY